MIERRVFISFFSSFFLLFKKKGGGGVRRLREIKKGNGIEEKRMKKEIRGWGGALSSRVELVVNVVEDVVEKMLS